MQRRLSIEVDFDTRKPYIKVINDTKSDDVRDQFITDFRHQLEKTSQWCKISFPVNSTEPVITMRIDPITPDQFKEQAEAMMYEHNRDRNSNVKPVLRDIVNSLSSSVSPTDAFREAALPLIKYLCENHHPHVAVIVSTTDAQLFEGIKSTGQIIDYLKD